MSGVGTLLVYKVGGRGASRRACDMWGWGVRDMRPVVFPDTTTYQRKISNPDTYSHWGN